MLELELDPPSTAFPAAISSIAAAAKPVPSAAPQKVVASAAIEASPSFMFASGLRSSFSFGHEGFAQVDDQSMCMDES